MHPVDLFNAREVIDSLIEERDAYSATSMEMERENWRLTAEVANLKHDTERHIAIASSEADARVKAEAELAAHSARITDLLDANRRLEAARLGKEAELAALREAAEIVVECATGTGDGACYKCCDRLRDALGR